ncbi:hypothetical protein H6P81_018418 [Aristolochia fimbriata]|uniref:Chlororespiratory reduction 21 n=1 Tax=Aristolochia fimbriata TaxID=158543 RepID=A0AAV7E1A8_ARIFI|nr:hypothetical protein H6P81_018418 [Aristolochia fimbriata]
MHIFRSSSSKCHCFTLLFGLRSPTRHSTFSAVPTHGDITHLILQQKSAAEVLKTFRWASGIRNFRHNKSTYKAVIQTLCAFRQFQTVDNLLEEMPSTVGALPDEAIFLTIVKGYARAGMVKKAIAVLDSVSQFGKKPTLKLFNSVLDVLVSEDIDLAKDFYKEKMICAGFEGDDYTFGILMKGLCSTNRVGDAFKLLSLMKSRGLKPNTVIYNTLLHALCRLSKVGRARSLMREMVEPNDVTFNIMISAYCKEGNLVLALVMLEKCFKLGLVPDIITVTKVLDALCHEGRVMEAVELMETVEKKKGSVADVVAYNSLVKGFCLLGKAKAGVRLLKEMERKGCLPNLSTYNLLISAFCELGDLDSALDLFREMGTVGIGHDFITYDTLIKGLCSGGRIAHGFKLLSMMEENAEVFTGHITTICRYFLFRGLQTVAFSSAHRTHCLGIKTGALVDISTANKLLTAYGKLNAVKDACQLFDEMPLRDTVSWNSMITAYVNSGDCQKSLELLKSMKRSGILCDEYTFGSILKGVACSNWSKIGRQLHSIIVKMGLDSNVFPSSALVDMYAKCGRIGDAGKVFECMVERNVVTWNAMVGGHAQAGDRVAAFWFLERMEKEQVGVNEATFASLLTLLDDPQLLQLTSEIHAKIVKHGLESETIVYNAIITSYSDCGSTESSEKVFHSMGNNRDLVTWNSMLAAYAQTNCGLHAIELFVRMNQLGIKQDMYTYTSVISACFEPQQQRQGKALHGFVAKTGLEFSIPVSNALIAMYLKTDKCMSDAIKFFNFMDVKDSVSWNSILTGFSQNRFSEEALKFFSWMRSANIEINQYSLSAVFQSCSDMAILQLGQQIHALATKLGFEQNDFVASSMIFMYSKCGVVDDARKSFNESNKNVSISWNSIIFGYAQYGQGTIALHLFSQMLESGVQPDHITFVGIISACSHVGLVEEGLKFLNSMESAHGVSPRVEHYACAVDLLGRAGRLDDAKALIESMPYEPDAMVWKSLLGACRIHGNVDLAIYAAKHLEALDPQEHSTYLILSDLYAHLGRWNERALVKKMMRNKGLRKVPGWSWIEVNNKVHCFNADDQSHPLVKDIYETLEQLMLEMERCRFVAFDDSDYEE